MQLCQRFFPRLRIVLRELRHVSLHLQGRQRAAQLVGGIGRKAALAGHHLLGACEEVIQRVEQGAHFRGHTLKHKRIGRIRRAGAQGLRQLFERPQLPDQEENQQKQHHRQRHQPGRELRADHVQRHILAVLPLLTDHHAVFPVG